MAMDLREWKEQDHCDECETPNKVRLAALINRLEAAEKVCKDVEPMVDHYELKSWYKWRKVAGKEE